MQCSDDGQTFRSLQRATLQPREAKTIAFDETRAKHFRVLFLSSHPYHGRKLERPGRGDRAVVQGPGGDQETAGAVQWDHSARGGCDAVRGSRRAVWTGMFRREAGRVLRIGYTLHGNAIKCVGSGPSGLEIDTMSAEAMDAHFAETGAKLIADAGPLAGKTLQYFHIDSWELGQPTWTPKMREEFQRRRGYDPLPWLPAVLGQTVDNAAETPGSCRTTAARRPTWWRPTTTADCERVDGQRRSARHASGIRRAVLHALDRRASVPGHQRHADGRVLEAQLRAGWADVGHRQQSQPEAGRQCRAHLRQAGLPGRSLHVDSAAIGSTIPGP